MKISKTKSTKRFNFNINRNFTSHVTGGNTFTERWTEEAIWTYKVVEVDFYPASDDDLYQYSISATGEQVPLSVLKVVLDPSLNADEQLLELDPVFYLVFQQNRNRLAGIIEFLNIDGERVEKAYSSNQLNRLPLEI